MRPLPQNICDRAKLLTSVHCYRTVAEIIGVSKDVITKVKRRGWKAAEPGRKKRPRPSDFAIQVRHMDQLELKRHYRTGADQITRWRRELGL